MATLKGGCTMDAKFDVIMKKMAEYIENTQVEIDKHNEAREAYLKRAHQIGGVLANKGLIAKDKVNAFVDKAAENEDGTEVWNLVEKLANSLPVEELGKISEVAAPGVKLDPFEKWVILGDARADTATSGMVD